MASCCICGKSPAKISLSGLAGKVCSECQENISNIRRGRASLAKEYFGKITFVYNDSQNFIANQFIQYADAVDRNVAELNAIEQKESFEKEVQNRINDMIITTTQTVDGYRIEKYIDIVYAESVYKMSFGKSLSSALSDAADSLRIFSNNELSGTSLLMKEAKDFVKGNLIRQAAAIGANAIVGIDIESTVGSDGVAKASINGTAVIIEKIN